MQKHEFLKKVSDKMGESALSQSKTNEVITAAFEVIAEALEGRDTVSIPGFGSFRTEFQPARMGRNPQTKEPMELHARYKVKFKPSSLLSQRVANF